MIATESNETSAAEADWTARLQAALNRYDAGLLRQVAGRLLRARSTKPVEELTERMTATVQNAAAVDRRLKEVEPAGVALLSLISQSGAPSWRLGHLLELLSTVPDVDGMTVLFELLEMGLLYPELPESGRKLRGFEEWLGQASATGYRLFAHPQVAARALAIESPLPPIEFTPHVQGAVREADGLDYLIRLGILWQRVRELPLRLTQQGVFFKRDQERLAGDGLLSGPSADELVSLPDKGHLLVGLALSLGWLHEADSQISVKMTPRSAEKLSAALRGLWVALLETQSWDAVGGWRGLAPVNGATWATSPYATASLLSLSLLGRAPEGAWVSPAEIGRWLAAHHCHWREQPHADLTPWAERFLLGLAYDLRLTQAVRTDKGASLVRLSPMGRFVLGLGPAPESAPFPKTLLVQPNLELVAYRQGLTPALIGELTRFCEWKNLGAACTLQLTPATVYRGLETGLPPEQIVQLLQQHGVRDLPEAVVQSLRTWAGKRERIAVYPSATVLEFAAPENLQEALGRGLPGVRIADRLLVVAGDGEIDYRHFRLSATRDYTLPPEQCVSVDADGVTLHADVMKADLLLDTELRRFAEPSPAGSNGRSVYRLTPASLQQAKQTGLTLPALGEWFRQRTGGPLTAAAQLLWGDTPPAPLALRNLLVLQVPSTLLADGLMEWPETRQWIHARLGEQSLVIEEANVGPLEEKLRELGLRLNQSHRVDSENASAPPQ